jgi:hypothetical protein
VKVAQIHFGFEQYLPEVEALFVFADGVLFSSVSTAFGKTQNNKLS